MKGVDGIVNSLVVIDSKDMLFFTFAKMDKTNVAEEKYFFLQQEFRASRKKYCEARQKYFMTRKKFRG